jgi:hypothetical protein
VLKPRAGTGERARKIVEDFSGLRLDPLGQWPVISGKNEGDLHNSYTGNFMRVFYNENSVLLICHSRESGNDTTD